MEGVAEIGCIGIKFLIAGLRIWVVSGRGQVAGGTSVILEYTVQTFICVDSIIFLKIRGAWGQVFNDRRVTRMWDVSLGRGGALITMDSKGKVA